MSARETYMAGLAETQRCDDLIAKLQHAIKEETDDQVREAYQIALTQLTTARNANASALDDYYASEIGRYEEKNNRS